MITMAVSAVVVSLAYLTLSTVQNYFSLVQERNNRYNEWLSARLFLSRDMDGADSVKSFGQSILFFSNDSSIVWQAQGDTLKRVEKSSKSFGLMDFGLRSFSDPENGMVNQLVLSQARGEEDTLHFRFYKSYPVAFKINR